MLDYNEVYGADNAKFAGKPHGCIQWKGTDVCIDLHCECGAHGHVDADFFYHYRCAACGRGYAVGMNVALIPLTPAQVAVVDRGDEIAFLTDQSVCEDGDADQP